MPGLPATGELSYNGYTFDGATHIEVQVNFVYDDAGRTIVAHKHTIKVEAVISNDKDLDSDIEDIRKRLGEPGKELTFINKGFGDDLKITPTGTTRDVMKGPLPKELSWSPLGDNKSAGIVWQVETTVSICKRPRSQGVLAINYGTDYVIDPAGDTIRTLKGYIQIAQQSVALRPADTVDRYRDAFAPAGISGFKREQSWSISLDKSRVNFVITDTQIASVNPYPPGIVNISANHRQSWRRGASGLTFRNTISARITPEARLSGAQAWQVFLTIVIQRMAWAKRRGQAIFLDALEVEEGIFSRTHNFSVSYRMLSSIKDFIGDSGMWRAVGTNWDLWRASLSHSMFHNRGNARLRDVRNNDILVSLCESPGIANINPNNRQEFQNLLTPIKPSSPGLKNERPPKNKSYIAYDSVIIPSRERPVVRQSIIQDIERLDPSWLLEPVTDFPPEDFRFETSSSVKPDVIQTGGSSRYSVRLVGRAKRAGYKIARPAILKVGDQPVTEVRSWFPQRVEGNYFGVPVYEALWDIEYILGQSPGRVDPLSNEQEQANASVASAPTTSSQKSTF